MLDSCTRVNSTFHGSVHSFPPLSCLQHQCPIPINDIGSDFTTYQTHFKCGSHNRPDDIRDPIRDERKSAEGRKRRLALTLRMVELSPVFFSLSFFAVWALSVSHTAAATALFSSSPTDHGGSGRKVTMITYIHAVVLVILKLLYLPYAKRQRWTMLR